MCFTCDSTRESLLGISYVGDSSTRRNHFLFLCAKIVSNGEIESQENKIVINGEIESQENINKIVINGEIESQENIK
jgi:hypothetical protein